jgi:hypothetical protein
MRFTEVMEFSTTRTALGRLAAALAFTPRPFASFFLLLLFATVCIRFDTDRVEQFRVKVHELSLSPDASFILCMIYGAICAGGPSLKRSKALF